ncbi:LOW QUALITY PROTEIN: hypothetical protein PanWU01x14_022780 [Parasponia andersonii]|uniref:Uncharacterized protein n=1 Tax=Parasponia andersonii TaxID=3476 RepID=A0A2P5DXA8_PARAD|nr:LOW QUALITY PROTEIN: hypothetical protein PanWU01x14_022780 [Parasponia andersonii]
MEFVVYGEGWGFFADYVGLADERNERGSKAKFRARFVNLKTSLHLQQTQTQLKIAKPKTTRVLVPYLA